MVTFLAFIIFSCKKDSGSKIDTNQFTFTYNGIVYNAAMNNNQANAAAINVGGASGIFIDMPSIFGGRIFFRRAGCAYLEPGSQVINVTEPNCQLSIQDNFGNPQPIDSAEAYIYQAGSLNVSFSECQFKKEVDIFTGQTNQYQVCRASGTFDLTLINKNNQKIILTNGKVNQLIRL